ncbi:MAG: MBL fold metallo-hydrolase [Gemmatimonadota bacterium]|jgi:glyoxylase-like metal-dependent hydrolase (beta-lactamase superfamily II)|nr:MAG: MBL fold metallo-hydrolase [Gemmatimonadota bacterium]
MIVCESGGLRVRTVDAGRLRLDGGAMFGVVPKPLWSARIQPDERNRIELAMRCLLIESDERVVLVDTGLGHKEDEKFREIYGVENEGQPSRLEDSLRAAGVDPESVDTVVCTHLHFDHAGGATRREPDGAIVPAFSRARYVIRRGEWDFAHQTNERVRASYRTGNFEPLAAAGMVDFVDEDREVAPGIQVVRTPGHTPHHQSVIVRAGELTVFYPADLAPTHAHLPLPWMMGYDVEPLVTLESKRTWLSRAGTEGWRIVLCHDPLIATGVARPAARGGCELMEVRRDGESTG